MPKQLTKAQKQVDDCHGLLIVTKHKSDKRVVLEVSRCVNTTVSKHKQQGLWAEVRRECWAYNSIALRNSWFVDELLKLKSEGYTIANTRFYAMHYSTRCELALLIPEVADVALPQVPAYYITSDDARLLNL